MGNRLSAISTRTGDDGTTGLGDGTRVSKNSMRVAAMGDVDELNSNIGVLRAQKIPTDIDQLLSRIQHDLFDMGGELCIPGYTLITLEHVLRLDTALAHYNASLPKLAEFILPAGSPGAAQAHVCRTVARRAERCVVSLEQCQGEVVNDPLRLYLNRLSDLLFVLARVLNRAAGGTDVLWQHTKNDISSDN